MQSVSRTGKSRNSHGGKRVQKRWTCSHQASSRSLAACAPPSTAVADAFDDDDAAVAVADYRTFCVTTIVPASLTFSPWTRRKGDSR